MTCTTHCDEIHTRGKTFWALIFTLAVISVVEIVIFKNSESSKRNDDTLQNTECCGVTYSGCSNSSDDYFNRRYFHITRKSISYDVNNVISRKYDCDSCHRHRHLIREYKMPGGVIRCLDSLSAKRNRRPLHIAFIGDSIIRHHFFSFLRWIPDYDRKISNNATLFVAGEAFHGDRSVTSHLLDDLQISFYWRNLIKNDVLTDFQRWASTGIDYVREPDFILIGITAHHLADDTSSLQDYVNLLENELVPLINQSLNNHPQQEIIWLRQSATIEHLTPSIYRAIHNEKITKFNDEIRRIFKNTRVVMWDTANDIVEEYLRACALTSFQRRNSSLYVNCNDFIHPGFGTIAMESLLIFNHICHGK